jgi:ribosome-associated protein
MMAAETLEYLRTAASAALDKKAFQLVGLEVTELTSLADGFVLCSGASERQVGAIAAEVERRLRDAGRRPLHVEGASGSEWVLLDYGDFVVHVFTESTRSYYGLDSLWGDAPRIDPGLLGARSGPDEPSA